MTIVSTIGGLVDYFALAQYQASLGLFVGGLLFAYFAIKNDHHRTMFAYYALMAAGLMIAAAYKMTG